jgi:hypothetical protein
MWYFRWHGGQWNRLTSRWMDRFSSGEVALEAGESELRFASMALELEERMPMEMGEPSFDRWPVLADGKLDQAQVKDAVAALTPLGHEGNVVHAEGKFYERRYHAAVSWEPNDEQRRLLAEAMIEAGISHRLARRVLE